MLATDNSNTKIYDLHQESVVPGLNTPYRDSRYFRKDKPIISLKSPSVTYPKQDIRLLEDL